MTSIRAHGRRRGLLNNIRKMPMLSKLLIIIFSFIFVFLIITLHRITNLDINCSQAYSKDQIRDSIDEKKKNSQSFSEQTKIAGVAKSYFSEWKFDYYGPDPAIQSYNPTLNPILKEKKKTRVRLFTEVFNRKTQPMNECKHILHDGLVESSILELQGVTYTLQNKLKANDFDESWKDDQLWILDAHHLMESCDILVKLIKQTLEIRDQQPWMILGVDYGDNHDGISHCEEVPDTIGQSYYRVAKRSIGVNRKWSEKLQFPERGGILPQPQPDKLPILHLPYPIRTDISRGVAEAVLKQKLINPLETKRNIDIAHFYKRQADVGVKAYFDNLRNGINIILRFMESMPLSNQRKIEVFTGLAGADKRVGRNGVSMDYVETMLRSKIIIVAQRDAWSDHYRLMEALNAGALVIADETLVLPRGLRNFESIVIFTSLQELREKLLYYLEHDSEREKIARRGWEIAMGYHRSWHAMEGVIFGTPVTDAGNAEKSFQRDTKSSKNK